MDITQQNNMEEIKKIIRKIIFEGIDPQELLKEKLLSLGGVKVKLGLDSREELMRMLNDGVLLGDSKRVFVVGQPNQCHRNSSDLYKRQNKYRDDPKRATTDIMSGYALSKKVWVQHSWLVTSFGYVEETTKIKFKSYYGYKLTPEESEEFCDANY